MAAQTSGKLCLLHQHQHGICARSEATEELQGFILRAISEAVEELDSLPILLGLFVAVQAFRILFGALETPRLRAVALVGDVSEQHGFPTVWVEDRTHTSLLGMALHAGLPDTNPRSLDNFSGAMHQLLWLGLGWYEGTIQALALALA